MEDISPQRQQLLANIATVVECLKYIPGVIAINLQEVKDDDSPIQWRGALVFAGCDEPVCIDLY